MPFAITVDSTSSVTIRERDSRKQIHVSLEEVVRVILELSEGRSTWADVKVLVSPKPKTMVDGVGVREYAVRVIVSCPEKFR